MDRIIEVKVGGNYISKDNKNAGVRGEANVTKLRIAFDGSWDDYAKKITFWDARGLNPRAIFLDGSLLEDYKQSERVFLVPIPAEPMAEAGALTFVIDGLIGDKRQRSVSDKLEIKDAPIDDEALRPDTPTPTEVEQMQLQLEGIKNNIAGAMEAKEDIENMSVSVETLSSDEEVFVEKIEKDGVVNLHFGIPAGTSNLYANAIKGTAKGDIVILDDISPFRHTIDVKVGNKDVLPYPYQEKSKTEGALSITDNGDGSITLNGTSNLRTFGLYRSTSQTVLKKGKTYIQSLRYADGTIVEGSMFLNTDVSVDGSTWIYSFAKNTTSFVVNEDYKGLSLFITIGMGTYDNVTLYPCFEEVIDPTSVCVIVQDKNGVEIERVTPSEEGTAQIKSVSPTMSILSDTPGVNIECVYNRDTNAVVKEITNSNITIDTEMSDTSENAVQNKVIKKYVDDITGDVETALDNIIAEQESIIAIQNALIGGGSV